MSGKGPEKKLLPRSRYCNLTQSRNCSVIGPWSWLWPRESFCRDFNWQIEWKGREPVRRWLNRSSWVIWSVGSQVTPVKLQGGLWGCQEEKKVVVAAVWRVVLRLRRSWRSVLVEWVGEKRERRESRERKWRVWVEVVADDGMVEGLGEAMRGFWRWFENGRGEEEAF